jgi:geranylgeranyl reductase family protein
LRENRQGVRVAYDFDVIVTGAGPGGSTAARWLARSGARVGLFDRAAFPRPKVCAGCLSTRIDRFLPASYRGEVERSVRGVRFTLAGERAIRRRSKEVLAHLVTRQRFDQRLVEEAVQAGAELYADERVRGIRELADAVVVETPRRQYWARFLVGADGANGVAAKLLGLRGERAISVGLECEAIVPAAALEASLDEVAIDWGLVPRGYGWVFPKADHLSVGVAGDREAAGHPRPLFLRYVAREQALASASSETIPCQGYLIPYHRGRRTLATARSVLIGDAASLADPLLLEGIYYAVVSGKLAANSLLLGLAGAPHPTAHYEHSLLPVYADLDAAGRLAFLLHRFPTLGYQILERSPRFLEEYFAVLVGRSSYQRLWRMVLKAGALKLLRGSWVGRMVRPPAP